jgi:hypothetical protein
MAAGTSSTKQVYPPSFAGSKTAVSFMAGNCHAAFRLATQQQTVHGKSISPMHYPKNRRDRRLCFSFLVLSLVLSVLPKSLIDSGIVEEHDGRT